MSANDERMRGWWLAGAVWFVSVAACCAALDLVTKHLVFRYYFSPHEVGQEVHWWIDGIFGIQTSTNPGALFGMGPGYSLWFAAASVVFFLFILVWLFVLKGAQDRTLTISLGLIAGGIFGNFYDRIGWGWSTRYPEEIRHHVRDWILFRLPGVPGFDPWPNFNVADSCLVVGAACLIIHSFLMHRGSVPSVDTEDV